MKNLTRSFQFIATSTIMTLCNFTYGAQKEIGPFIKKESKITAHFEQNYKSKMIERIITIFEKLSTATPETIQQLLGHNTDSRLDFIVLILDRVIQPLNIIALTATKKPTDFPTIAAISNSLNKHLGSMRMPNIKELPNLRGSYAGLQEEQKVDRDRLQSRSLWYQITQEEFKKNEQKRKAAWTKEINDLLVYWRIPGQTPTQKIEKLKELNLSIAYLDKTLHEKQFSSLVFAELISQHEKNIIKTLSDTCNLMNKNLKPFKRELEIILNKLDDETLINLLITLDGAFTTLKQAKNYH
jgi:hypothetical protein